MESLLESLGDNGFFCAGLPCKLLRDLQSLVSLIKAKNIISIREQQPSGVDVRPRVLRYLMNINLWLRQKIHRENTLLMYTCGENCVGLEWK